MGFFSRSKNSDIESSEIIVIYETVLIFFVDFNVNNVESQSKNMPRNRTRLALTTRYVLIDLITNRFIGCEQCTIIRECMFFFANPKDFACRDFG